MESAKSAVKSFLAKAGSHDTTVHESVAPAVQHETRVQTQHENVTTAVNRERHQDHHHVSIQPVKDKKVLPEEHHHRMMPVEQKHFEHENPEKTKGKLASEAAQFKDEHRVVQGRRSTSTMPAVTGEQTHHHVHEYIQPVIEQETVEPHILHTTVPVHEVHHDKSKYYNTSTLPAVTMEEFQKKENGSIVPAERTYEFEGQPEYRQGDLRRQEAVSTADQNSMMDKPARGQV